MNRLLKFQSIQFPIATLLHPREQTRAVLLAIALGLILGGLGMRFYDWPLWVAAALFLAVLLVPGIAKWQADHRRYGLTAMGVSFLLVTQGFHSIEHIVQWFQYHALNWTMRASSGILSPANSEWVHFTWNWLVVIIMAALAMGGVRSRWAWLLLVWAITHTLEHTYMFTRYLLVLDELKKMGITHLTAQGLPGILGQGGWLAESAWTRGTFLSRLPGLTTAIRLDVHFWWNIGEMTLLLFASHTYLRTILRSSALASSRAEP
jgi:hypothetical protein